MSTDSKPNDRSGASLFREQAVRHHLQAASRDGGAILRLIPPWQRHLFVAVNGVLLASLLLLCTIELDVSVEAPAVVQDEGLVEVMSHGSGMIASVEVGPGDHVVRGQALVRFAASELPFGGGGVSAGRALAAPFEGTIQDVWALPGRNADPGHVLLRIRKPGTAARRVIAFFAPTSAPPLGKGDPLWLRIPGQAQQNRLRVEGVSAGAIGPSQFARFSIDAQEMGGKLSSPVIIVKALSIAPSTDEQHAQLADGTEGTVTAVVRRQRLIFRILPSLEGLLKGG
jgi:hypothetical protein